MTSSDYGGKHQQSLRTKQSAEVDIMHIVDSASGVCTVFHELNSREAKFGYLLLNTLPVT